MTEYDWNRAPHHVAYRTTREHVTTLLTERPGSADLPVDSCPGWTVRDAVAHLVGICRMVAGLPAEGPEPGSEAGEDVGDLLGVWAHVGARTEHLVESADRGRSAVLVMDAVTHELDIRHALGTEPPAEHPAYPTAFRVVMSGFSGAVRERGLPPLLIETSGARWTAGEGRPAATVGGPRHDVLRSFSGRRSHGQIARLAWSQAPEPWLPAFRWGPFTPPAQPVE